MTDDLQIEIVDVDKHYGAFQALQAINLAIPKGEFVALVGPSGCGKSTLLRSIAGLERISSGDIRIDGETMHGVPPRKRDLAMVFQSYALYPHMTVRQNLSYSLRLKRVPKAEVERQTQEVAELIGLIDLLDRYPRALSGGQRQRVAMGRAIVRHPKAFLFDEPLSNLDASLRVQMRKEIRALHDRLGATSVYVTHDQIEAMTMADHVVVLRDGRVEQNGDPITLYDHPANRFVAGFIGSPAMNFVEAVVDESGTRASISLNGSQSIDLPEATTPGQAVTLGMRPEHLALCPPDTPGALSLPVRVVEPTGAALYIYTDTEPELLVLHMDRADIHRGDRLSVAIAPDRVHMFDPASGASLRRNAPPEPSLAAGVTAAAAAQA